MLTYIHIRKEIHGCINTQDTRNVPGFNPFAREQECAKRRIRGMK